MDRLPGEENDDRRVEWLPTPEEIAAGCAKIQAEWTDAERRKRAGVRGLQPVKYGRVYQHPEDIPLDVEE